MNGVLIGRIEPLNKEYTYPYFQTTYFLLWIIKYILSVVHKAEVNRHQNCLISILQKYSFVFYGGN